MAWRQPEAASRTVDRLEVATVPVAGSVAAFECQEWAAMSRRRRWRAAECCSASVPIMVEKLGQSPARFEHDGRAQRHRRVGHSWRACMATASRKQQQAMQVRLSRSSRGSCRSTSGSFQLSCADMPDGMAAACSGCKNGRPLGASHAARRGGSVAAFERQEWAATRRRGRWRAAECCSASVFIMVEKLG